MKEKYLKNKKDSNEASGFAIFGWEWSRSSKIRIVYDITRSFNSDEQVSRVFYLSAFPIFEIGALVSVQIELDDIT